MRREKQDSNAAGRLWVAGLNPLAAGEPNG
jgi:hypothetical protein